MADSLYGRRGEMKDSASLSENGSDLGDNTSQDNKDDNIENDSGYMEDRFRVDRKKLEQMLQGNWEHRDEAAEDFFQRIMEETNTQISWPSKLKIGAKSKKDPHIKVIGLPDDVRVAKDLIMAVLDTKTNRATLKMDVSHTDHSHVIGKGGNNIKRVMHETGCHVHFPDSNRGNNVQEKSNQVSIAGQPLGVEQARIHIRELLPLVFMFELPVTGMPIQVPDVQSPTMQQIQKQYNVSISFRQRARMYATTVIVRGSVCNEKSIKEATLKMMELLIKNIATPLPVSMQLEIAPQHHLFIIGRGGMNIKQIMQATGAVIHFPDPNTVTPQRKGTVYITGPIESVYHARQQLIGCLPLVLMFDVKEEIDMDQARITHLMEHLDVFISVKPKPKQPSKSVIVKSIERNASNMYLARLLLLGIEKELPRQPVIPVNGEGSPTHVLGLTALGYFGGNLQHQIIPTLSVNTFTPMNHGQVLLINGHKSPPAAPSVVTIATVPTATSNPPSQRPSPRSPHSPSTSSSPSHFVPPPPGIYSRMAVPPTSQCSVQSALEMMTQCKINGLHKDINQNNAYKQQQASHLDHGSRNQSEANSPARSPCESPHNLRENQNTNFRESQNTNFRESQNPNFRESQNPNFRESQNTNFRENTRESTNNFRENPNSVDLAGLSTVNGSNSFGGIVPNPTSSLSSSGHTMGLLGLSKSSLSSSGHTMDLLGLSKTTTNHHALNNMAFLNSGLSNGSLHSSLNRSSLSDCPLQGNGSLHSSFNRSSLVDLSQGSGSLHNSFNRASLIEIAKANGSLHNSFNRAPLMNGDERGIMDHERGMLDQDQLDLRAPGIERQNSNSNLFDNYQQYGPDYEQKKLMANKAMQQKPIGESRIPTDCWAGFGFSKSMPEAAIRERMAQNGVKQKYEPPMATTYENSMGEITEMDHDPWRDSVPTYNRPINPAPGEYPSPRKKYEFGLSASNHIDGALVPNKSYWSPKTDLAELFIKLGLGKYTDLFLQQEIDLSTFLTLNDNDLRELGISTFGARRKMLLAIADLNKRRMLAPSNPLEDPNPFHETVSPRGSQQNLASLSGRW